ncbi:hypothetical protein [Actibacterium sp. 188UL27-1]|uniref:hypothetical protein n=1 Tax=Actibacterium sp. 188UL27-1 TaxID=2786961 RepID=UPI00351C3FBC
MAVADEEPGGFGAVAYLAEKGYFSLDRVQHVIIPEPSDKECICGGHRDIWWAEIETKGHIARGSGILDFAHPPDEWVSIDDLVDGDTVMTFP